MLRVVEVLRHAALAADAVAERDALKTAREVVAPRMIHAGQRAGVAAFLQAHQRPLVRAAVHQCVDRAMLIARDDDRRFADGGEAPVARIGNFYLQTQKIPYRSTEQPPLFRGVDLGIREHTERHACHTVLRPDQIACKIARHRDVHHSPPPAFAVVSDGSGPSDADAMQPRLTADSAAAQCPAAGQRAGRETCSFKENKA